VSGIVGAQTRPKPRSVTHETALLLVSLARTALGT